MKLHVTTANEGSGTPVILTHGLYGQGRNMGVIARSLTDRQVYLVDQRNHGDSPWDNRHDYAALAQDMADTINDRGGKADLVGHSMGGKAVMGAALLYPELVERLVVMDMAPVPYTHTQTEYVEAMQALDLEGLTSRSEADRRFAKILPQPSLRAFFLQSLDFSGNAPKWKLNLDVLAANMLTVSDWPDCFPKSSFGGPVLFIHGADSDYVDESGRAAALEYFPQAQFHAVEKAGHWLHAERPKEVASTITGFLQR